MEDISLQTVIYGNSIKGYLIGLGLFAASFLIIYILLKITRRAIERITARLDNETVAGIIRGEKNLRPFFRFVPFYILIYYLTLPPTLETLIDKFGIIILGFCVVRYLVDIVRTLSKSYITRNNGNPLISHTVNLFAAIILYALGVLFVLSNLGFNINTLLAGVGIGGMAIALASQTLLADLFNYFTILIDKPFSIGDTITVGGASGTVEKIGLKGTRVRATGGELLIISNTDMTKNILSNFQIMEKRRILVTLGITYNTPKETVAEIPKLLSGIVKSVAGAEFSRAHFAAFAASSLDFELVYFVLSADYGVYMDCIQEVNLKILDEFEKRRIDFAYPTQSLYVKKPAE